MKTGEGPILITGCAHPGIVEMVKVTVGIVGEPMYLVLGGFHLLEKKTTEVRAITAKLKQLGVKQIGPCHCTGDRAITIFAEVFGESFIDVKTGTKIDLRS